MGTNGLLLDVSFLDRDSITGSRVVGWRLAERGESPDPYNGDFFLWVVFFLGMGGDESAVKDVSDTNKYPLPSAR